VAVIIVGTPYFIKFVLVSSSIKGKISTSYPQTLCISPTISFLVHPFIAKHVIILFISIAILLSLSYRALAFSLLLASLTI
jgi:hypothetical protein